MGITPVNSRHSIASRVADDERIKSSSSSSSSSLARTVAGGDWGEHPDGNWLWMVVLASFVCEAVSVGMAFSFGVYYVEFLEQFDGPCSQLAWVGALCAGALFATGPLSSVLANKFGFRLVVMSGAVLSSLGYIITSLVQDIISLLFSSGLLVGVGYGLIHTPAVAVVGCYSQKKRVVATGIAVSGIGFGTLTFASLFQFLIDTFGWRGSMLINAGVTLNVVAMGALMRPLAPQYRETMMSRDIFNTSLLKSSTFWIFFVNNVLFNVGSLILFVLLPEFSSGVLGLSKTQSAFLLSLIGILNTIGRLVTAALGKVNSRHLPFFAYTLTCGLTGVVTCLYAIYQSYAAFIAYSAAYGLLFGIQLAFLASLTADLFGVARLTSAYGYLMFANGAGALIGPPVAGLLFDVTRSYDAGFYFGGAVTIVAASIMVLVPYFKSRKKGDLEEGGKEREETGLEKRKEEKAGRFIEEEREEFLKPFFLDKVEE